MPSRRRRSSGHAPRGPRYAGLEFAAVLLNILGGVALLGGALLILAGVVNALDNRPLEGIATVFYGGATASLGVIQIGLASGLTALRDIARNTYAAAHPLR